MALDHEEMKRKRLQKQAQRKAQQRRLIVKLVIAGVVLAVCGAVIIGVTSLRKPQDAPQAEAETTQPRDVTTIQLAAVGDINITDRVIQSGTGTYDYTNLFLDVAPVLAGADLTVGNFEGTLGGPPYGGSKQAAPHQFAQALVRAGVDGVQVANSYSMSGGLSGLQQTLAGLKTAGLMPMGAFENNAAFRESSGYTVVEVQGVRIVFVAFTKGMGGTALLEGSKDCVNLLYKDYTSTYQEVDTEGIQEVLEAAQREKPDLVVAMLHWGSEYNDTISKSQEKICNLMKQNGVDVILGSHSHFLQKMEKDPETGTFTAWSLGDFLGDGERAGSDYSVILNLQITKDNKAGTTEVTGFDYTPVYIVNEKDQPLRLVRIREAVAAYEAGQLSRVSEQTYQKMVYALERIEKRIAGE